MTASSTAARVRAVVRLARPEHWTKNGFVLAPLIFSGQFLEPGSVGVVLAATLVFCVASSAGYVLNDIRDMEHDRRHPVKAERRPLAAGEISRRTAIFVLIGIYVLVAAGLVALPALIPVVVGYLALNLAYTFVLKHQPIVDIFTIAVGFVFRVYAGAVVIAVPVSHWMFVTTLCLALYLAAVKRRQELATSGTAARDVLTSYSPALIDRYAEMSATGALVFYSLFVLTDMPELILTVPLVLFGLFRYWYVVEEHGGGESPTDALLADRPLLLTVVVWLGACVWVLWREGL